MVMLLPIPGPPNRPTTSGLLAVADRPTDVDPEWVRGFAVEPESCDGAVIVSTSCEPSATPKPLGENVAAVTYLPPLILAGEKCSTLSGRRQDVSAARATATLRATEGAAVERLLWTGQAADDDLTPDRPYLASPTVTELAGGAAVGLVQGLSLLDQALTDCLDGRTGMVHVTPYVLARAATDSIIERDPTGSRWLTPNGHIVVGGSGYTGQGPRPADGAELPAAPDLLANPPADQWAYGTGMVSVLLGPIQDLPSTNRRDNDAVAYAERPAAAYWTCCHFGVQLTLVFPA